MVRENRAQFHGMLTSARATAVGAAGSSRLPRGRPGARAAAGLAGRGRPAHCPSTTGTVLLAMRNCKVFGSATT